MGDPLPSSGRRIARRDETILRLYRHFGPSGTSKSGRDSLDVKVCRSMFLPNLPIPSRLELADPHRLARLLRACADANACSFFSHTARELEDAAGASSDWWSRIEAQGFVKPFPAIAPSCVSFTVNVSAHSLGLS
jgi:hypothetical protein